MTFSAIGKYSIYIVPKADHSERRIFMNNYFHCCVRPQGLFKVTRGHARS